MYINFYGAVREVTGSMHLIGSGQTRVLLDCGMFQGHRKEAAEKNRIMPIDPGEVTNVILSHAHIDHSGRLPLFCAKGAFTGQIVCTSATRDVCKYLLLDAAHIQESDAAYLNYKALRNVLLQMKDDKTYGGDIKAFLKKNRYELNVEHINQIGYKLKLDMVEPLYTAADAENAISLLHGYPYGTEVKVGPNMTAVQYNAGHILGSAITFVKVEEDNRLKIIAFSGDMGRFDKPIIKDPQVDFPAELQNIDLMILESTYGNREHDPASETKPKLQRIINETIEIGGTLLISAFAFGRAQELIYYIHELYDEKAIPNVPVYVDSPLANNITKVFGEHPELYDTGTHATFLEKGKNPFDFKSIHFIQSTEESMKLTMDNSPHIVLASSGMMEAGRILHHLRYKIHNHRTTILISGYMAANTLGRRIADLSAEYTANNRKGPAPTVKILGKDYALNARVETLDGLSAHADKNEIKHWLKASGLNIKRIALVHGEEDQMTAFASDLRGNGYTVEIPFQGQTILV